MPEAVIAAARSPIGRAYKGSLKDLRPDDLAARIIRTALDQVPQLDPGRLDDLILGCGVPGGEQGFNMGRVVAVLLGHDDLPGTTVTRYCASSLQTTRMAFHAIRAGEGEAFVSAGVECVSRYVKGNADTPPPQPGADPRDKLGNPWVNPSFAEAQQRTGRRAQGGEDSWHDPREDGTLPDVYIAMGQTAENVAELRGITREDQDEFGAMSQNRAEKAIAEGFFEREITPVTLPDGRVVAADDGPRPGTTVEVLAGLKPGFRPDGTVTAGNCCPLNDGAAAVVVMSDELARQLGITPLARIVATGVTALAPEIMGLAARVVHRPEPHDLRRQRGHAGGRLAARAGAGRHDHRRHGPRGDQRGLRRPGDPQLPRPRDRRRAAQPARWRDRGRPPLRDDRRQDHLHPPERPALPRRHPWA